MITFEIDINGKRFCKAGISENYGILSAILHWSNRDLSEAPKEVREKVPSEELKLTVSGQERTTSKEYENISWGGSPLKAGDEVRIKITDSSDFDEPKYRNPRIKS